MFKPARQDERVNGTWRNHGCGSWLARANPAPASHVTIPRAALRLQKGEEVLR
jgi:hypothetical protein